MLREARIQRIPYKQALFGESHKTKGSLTSKPCLGNCSLRFSLTRLVLWLLVMLLWLPLPEGPLAGDSLPEFFLMITYELPSSQSRRFADVSRQCKMPWSVSSAICCMKPCHQKPEWTASVRNLLVFIQFAISIAPAHPMAAPIVLEILKHFLR